MTKLPALRQDEPEILRLPPGQRSAGAMAALMASGASTEEMVTNHENVTIFIEVTIPLILRLQ